MQPHGNFPQLSCHSIRTTDVFKLGDPSKFHRLSIEKKGERHIHCNRSGLHVLDVVWQQRTDLPFGLVKSATDRTVLLRCGLQVHFIIPLQKATIIFLISLFLLGTEQCLPDWGLWNFLFRSFTKICQHMQIFVKGKGKAHPRTGHEDLEREGETYSSILSLVLVLDGVGG